jgi:Zn-dependent oligopeptidase
VPDEGEGSANDGDDVAEGASTRSEAGQRLWRHLLRPGGSTDPFELLRNTLHGQEPTMKPFFQAMTK